MKKRIVVPFAALLALAPFASAQTARPSTTPPAAGQAQPGQPGGPRDPAFAATFDLLREVNGLSQLNKDPKTAISRAQAQKLLPILKGLQGAKTLPAASATKTLTQLEGVLTDTQLSALDALALKRQQGGPGQFGQGGQRGQTGQRNQAQGNQLQGGQGQFGQRGPGDAQGNATGRPARTPSMNPFTQGRGAQGLSALITTLTQTAR
jgi:hypothetical protein